MPVVAMVTDDVKAYLKQIGSRGGSRRTAKQRAATRAAIAASRRQRRNSFAARCRAAGVNRTTALWRLKHGWSMREALRP